MRFGLPNVMTAIPSATLIVRTSAFIGFSYSATDNRKHVPVHSRLVRACSLARFCWFCCLLPKNERLLPTLRHDCPETLEPGALRSGMPCHVMPSPSSGADAAELLECARERCLVAKSRLNRDIDQRHARLAHQMFGVVNTMLNQPLVSGGAERGFE